jgi:hypothetical protein
MAKVSNNIFVRGLSGSLGNQFSVRSRKNGRTTVAVISDYETQREPSEAQLAQQQAFREAIAYAKAMKGEEIYRLKADGSDKSPYNLAVADWFHAPEVSTIDLSGWDGAAGGTVRVLAHDDVQVKRVIVRFSDAGGELLEEGSASEAGANWWTYETQTPMSGDVTVTATAVDLPGNLTELSREKTGSV